MTYTAKTTNELYQAALKDRETSGERYGAARCALSTGDVVICSISPVAGRSIIGKHDRTSFGIVRSGEQYAKPIGRKAVAELLRSHN